MWSAAPILAAATAALTSRQIDELWVFGALSGVLSYLFAIYSHRSIGAYPWRLPPWLWGLIGVIFPPTLLVEAIARFTTRRVPSQARPATPGTYRGSESPAERSRPPAAPGPGQWGPPGPRRQPGESITPPAWQHAQADTPPIPPAWQQGQGGAPAAPPWPPPLGPEAFPPPHSGQPTYPAQPGYAAQPPYPGLGQPPYPGQPPYLAPPSYGTQSSRIGQTPRPSGQPGPEGWIPGSLYGDSPAPPPLFGWYADPTGRHEERYWDGRHWSDRVADNSVRSDDPLYPDPGAPSAEAGAVEIGAPGSESPPEVADQEPGIETDPPEGASMSDRLRGFRRSRG